MQIIRPIATKPTVIATERIVVTATKPVTVEIRGEAPSCG